MKQEIRTYHVVPEMHVIVEVERELIKYFASFASLFGAKVCVEGIETAGMRDILQKYHVESFQGYYYAKPLKLEEIVKFESKKVTT